MKKNYSREELIDLLDKYKATVLANPEEFGSLEGCENYGQKVVEELERLSSAEQTVHSVLRNRMMEYQAVAQIAIESCSELLQTRDKTLGRTTKSNRAAAELLEEDLALSQAVLKDLNTRLGITS